MTVLEIRDLHVSVDVPATGGGEAEGPKEILRGVDLTVRSGETHAIMGPNGSGKSTLAYSIAGHPKYHVTSGTVTLDGEDLLAMSVDERARAGLFLAMRIEHIGDSGLRRLIERRNLVAFDPGLDRQHQVRLAAKLAHDRLEHLAIEIVDHLLEAAGRDQRVHRLLRER